MRLAEDHEFDQIMVSEPNGEQIILTKVAGQVHAFRNSCPHVGVALDYGDGNCLYEPGVLVCSMHGALFEADSGYCLAGPCSGQSLERLPIEIVDGHIVLKEQ